MMREILGVAQEGTGVQRRWFHDDYFDLFTWQTDQGEITSFQLCYGLDSSERALEWRKDHGWFQDGKTTVEPVPRKILSTVLATPSLSGADPAEPIESRFEFAARDLPDTIRTGVGCGFGSLPSRMPLPPAAPKSGGRHGKKTSSRVRASRGGSSPRGLVRP